MEVYINPSKERWPEIISRPKTDYSGLRKVVGSLLEKVRTGGDRALMDITLEFDRVSIPDLQISKEEIAAADKAVSEELKEAIALARRNIEVFHKAQETDDRITITSPGVKCWTRTVPVEKVGLYIPGGTAPLLSTVLMLGIPACLAGCSEIILCSPPGRDGKIPASVLYCAGILGIEKIYRLGGAQAIAAMAYGTETIPSVDKIFGPGNRYVTVAKQLVSLENVAIDLPAGPSELAVIADETADPVFVAADLSVNTIFHAVDVMSPSTSIWVSVFRVSISGVVANKDAVNQESPFPNVYNDPLSVVGILFSVLPIFRKIF